MREWWSKLRACLAGRRAVDGDVADEMRAHFEMEADRYVEEGMSRAEALAMARRRFGNATRVAENARDSWGFLWFEGLSARMSATAPVPSAALPLSR